MPITLSGPAGTKQLEASMKSLVREALALEKRSPGEIGIALTGDAQLRELNRQYRGIDRATDVLSFTYEDDRSQVSGDLAISLDRMREQAKRFRVSQGYELARLAIHGALHLAGLDHHRPAERRHMRLQENRALRAAASMITRLDRALAKTGPAKKKSR
jgi:probable rRNA maturation factor